jgi:hypothetical protein
MVEMDDADLDEQRFFQKTWQNYELWEKVEARFRRKRLLWILATLFLVFFFSAIPVVTDRFPYWQSRFAAEQLAQEMNRMKREAMVNRESYRIRFLDPSSLSYTVEKVQHCSDAQGVKLRTSELRQTSEALAWLPPSQGEALGIPGLVSDFCYDPWLGNHWSLQGQPLVGFAILPAQDLQSHRLDRLSILLIQGPSAEMIFD